MAQTYRLTAIHSVPSQAEPTYQRQTLAPHFPTPLTPLASHATDLRSSSGTAAEAKHCPVQTASHLSWRSWTQSSQVLKAEEREECCHCVTASTRLSPCWRRSEAANLQLLNAKDKLRCIRCLTACTCFTINSSGKIFSVLLLKFSCLCLKR